MIVTMQDCRELGYCAYGVRRFFKEHDLDFKDFLKNGIEEEKLAATEQGLALKAIEHANERRQ